MTGTGPTRPAGAPGRRWVDRLRPERAFAVVAGVFGLALAFVTPPIQVPDEPNHWYRAYQIGRGEVFAVRPAGGGRYAYGGRVPLSVVACSARFSPLAAVPRARVTAGAVLSEFRRPLRPDADRFEDFPNTAVYSPLPYLPAAAGMAVGRWLSLPPVALLYAGRLGTLAAYVTIGWAAVRTTPVLKWPAAVVLAGPTGLFLAAAVSADPVTTATAFLATAVVLAWYARPGRLTAGSVATLVGVMVALSLCKSAYVPLAATVAAVPPVRRAAGRARGWAVAVAAVAAAVTAGGLWSATTHVGHLPPVGYRTAADDPAKQLAWVAGHPAAYAGVCWTTARDNLPDYVYQSVGQLGWLDTPLPGWFVATYLAAVAYLVLACGEPVPLGLRWRAWAAVAIVVVVGLIATADYAVWTPFRGDHIAGIQGRYFLPLALLGCSVVHRGRGLPVRPVWVTAFMAFVGLYTLYAVTERYYGPVR